MRKPGRSRSSPRRRAAAQARPATRPATAASSTASSAVSVTLLRSPGPSRPARAGSPPGTRAGSPRPPRRLHDHERPAPHLERRVGRGGGEADRVDDGQVVRRRRRCRPPRAGVRPSSAQDLAERRALVGDALAHHGHAELRRALGHRRPSAGRRARPSAARRGGPARCPGRRGCGTPWPRGRRARSEHGAVGHHAVHVGQHQPEAAGSARRAASSFISSPSSRGRAGGRRPPTRPSPSTTGSDVILRSSMSAEGGGGQLAAADE